MTSSVFESTADLSIRAETGEVRRASAWIEQTCRERGVPKNESGRLDVCLNETLANILAHGGEAALSAAILLHLEVNHDKSASEAIVTVSDAGAAFDPLAAPPWMPPKILAEAELGGLGLMMIRSSADSLRYRYLDGRNQLSFGVRWNGCGDG